MAGLHPTAALIDVIVLVFSKSEMRSLVGTDALKTVLEGASRALFPKPGTIDLQPIYELLESQPGFEPEKAVPPFCRLKTWELRLGMKVLMPRALEVLDTRTCELRAMNVNAFDSDLDKLIKPPPKAAPTTRVIESGGVEETAATKSSRRAKIAMAAALVGVVAAGVSLYLTFNSSSGNTTKLAAKELTEQVPLDHVRKSGDVIIATITDPAWLQKPEFDRRQQLEAVAVKMRTQQARTLLLVDKRGAVVGSIVLKGAPVISFIPQRAPKK